MKGAHKIFGLDHQSNIVLTPTDNGNADYELCCDTNEDYDQFLEH